MEYGAIYYSDKYNSIIEIIFSNLGKDGIYIFRENTAVCAKQTCESAQRAILRGEYELIGYL